MRLYHFGSRKWAEVPVWPRARIEGPGWCNRRFPSLRWQDRWHSIEALWEFSAVWERFSINKSLLTVTEDTLHQLRINSRVPFFLPGVLNKTAGKFFTHYHHYGDKKLQRQVTIAHLCWCNVLRSSSQANSVLNCGWSLCSVGSVDSCSPSKLAWTTRLSRKLFGKWRPGVAVGVVGGRQEQWIIKRALELKSNDI